MVAPMLMHGYTDATAAGQALIGAQSAIMLQVGVACHLAIPRRRLLGSLVARNRVSSAPIISAYPAYRWHSPRPQQSGATPNIAGLNLVRDVLGSELGVVTIECVKLPDGPVRHAVGSGQREGQARPGSGRRSSRPSVARACSSSSTPIRITPTNARDPNIRVGAHACTARMKPADAPSVPTILR